MMAGIRMHRWLLVALCAVASLTGARCAVPPPGPILPAQMSYLDNGHIRIGVNLALGGAITYLSKSGSTENLVNDYDRGRQIQLSFYSGPVPFEPNGKKAPEPWKALGWNPIQCGDCFGHSSQIITHRNDGKTLYVKCIPLIWPLDSVPAECTFEVWIQLEGNVVHVSNRLINHRTDRTQYVSCQQELPAVYTNGPWYHVMTYKGDQPFQGKALSEIPCHGLNVPLEATENWAALINDQGWGLGIWEPNVVSFRAWDIEPVGQGGPRDFQCGYISPDLLETLDHNIVYSFRYDMVLGTLNEIRRAVYQQQAKQKLNSPLPRYAFKTDRQHWHYVDATDSGLPITGELKVNLEQIDPQMIAPDRFWLASMAPKLYLRAAFHTRSNQAQVFWKRLGEPEFRAPASLFFPIIPDGEYRTYVVDLASSPEYRGAMVGLRIDPAPGNTPGDFVRVQSVEIR